MISTLLSGAFLLFIAIGVLYVRRRFAESARELHQKREALNSIDQAQQAGESIDSQQTWTFPWLAWCVRRVQLGLLVTLHDREAAVAELQRELHSIDGYDMLSFLAPKLPMGSALATALLAGVCAMFGDPLQIVGLSHLFLVSATFLILSLYVSHLCRRFLSHLNRLQTDALNWLDERLVQPGVRGGIEEQFQRLIWELRQPLAQLIPAVTNLTTVSDEINKNVREQSRLLGPLAPLGEELRLLRVSNQSVAHDARQALSSTQTLIVQAGEQIRQFGEVVARQQQVLVALEGQRADLADAGTELATVLQGMTSRVGTALEQVSRAQETIGQQAASLVTCNKSLEGTIADTSAAFRQCGQRVQEVASGIGTQVREGLAALAAFRQAVSESFVPAAQLHQTAASAMTSAAGTMRDSVAEIADGSRGLSSAAEALRTSGNHLAGTARVINETLGHAQEAMQASQQTLEELARLTGVMGPASDRFAAAAEGAESTVAQLAQTGDRMAEGVETRLARLDRDGLQPAIARLRELRVLFEQLQRDLNFSGAMQDFVNCVQELWQAAQEHQAAARALRSNGNRKTGGGWWWSRSAAATNGEEDNE